MNAEHGFYYCNVLVNTYSPDLYGEVNQKNVRIYVFRYRATPEGEREKPAEQIYLKQFDLLTGPLSPEATWNPAGTLTVTLTEQNSGQIRSRTVIDLHNLE